MATVAISGVSGVLGRALVPRLEPVVDRIVGLDVRDLGPHGPAVVFHRVDVATTDLKPLLEGIDVVIHLAGIADPIPDESLMTHVNIEGTRRLLEAASAVGARKVVRVSSTNVYGAWPNNAVPLTEDAPLRPNPGFTPAVHGAEVERLLAEWAEDHPTATVTTLRTAPVVGQGIDHLAARLLAGHPPMRIRGAAPPVQFVHVDDVVAALVLVARSDAPGVFNVAADGWLAAEDAAALMPRRLTVPVPEQVAERALAATWSTGLGEVPPSIMPYLEHPWVVANDRLKLLGWQPSHTNEEALIAGVPARPETLSTIARYAAVAAGALAVGAAVGWWGRRARLREQSRPA
ncbi:MAG: NAD-dependent epimerase/dehydratase family protein [Acidimicrobiia bacterium]